MKTSHVLIAGGLGALLLFFTRAGAAVTGAIGGALSGYGIDGALTVDQVRELARAVVAEHFPRVDPGMIVALAFIESSFRPSAFRLEASVGDASTGLLQMLSKTAAWLHTIGYNALPKPDATDLLQPATAVYFGAAYLDYLAHYAGEARDERFIVQAYNVGPARARELTGPGPYFNRYLAARERFG